MVRRPSQGQFHQAQITKSWSKACNKNSNPHTASTHHYYLQDQLCTSLREQWKIRNQWKPMLHSQHEHQHYEAKLLSIYDYDMIWYCVFNVQVTVYSKPFVGEIGFVSYKHDEHVWAPFSSHVIYPLGRLLEWVGIYTSHYYITIIHYYHTLLLYIIIIH